MFKNKAVFDIKNYTSWQLKEKCKRIYDFNLDNNISSRQVEYQNNLRIAIDVMHNAAEGRIKHPYGITVNNSSYIKDIFLAIKHLQTKGYEEFPLSYKLVLESYESIIGKAIEWFKEYIQLFKERNMKSLPGENNYIMGDNQKYLEALEKFKKDINDNLFKDLAPETSLAK
jgi:hypothetical protein